VSPALGGRRCVVTGASGGIGEAIAHTLVEHGADVVVTAREGPRLAAAVDRLRDVRRGAKVQAIGADLALQAEVRRVAATLGTDPVDVLVLNAAVIPAARVETRDGLEQTLAVDHLAPFLLTQLLRPRFTPRTRVVVVGADPGWSSREPVDLDDLAFSDGFSPARAYMRTKNMKAMFTYALARRLSGTGITVNAAHPGVIATSLGRRMHGLVGLALAAARPFLPSPTRGADTPAWLAWSPEVAGVSGHFFVKRRRRATAAHTLDVERQDALWSASEALTGSYA